MSTGECPDKVRALVAETRAIWHQSAGQRKLIEHTDRDGDLITTYSIAISAYLHQTPQRGQGIAGQPVPHHYFDRPLSVLLAAGFQASLVLDGLAEPEFGDEARATHPFSWANSRDIPPVLVARMRLSRRNHATEVDAELGADRGVQQPGLRRD